MGVAGRRRGAMTRLTAHCRRLLHRGLLWSSASTVRAWSSRAAGAWGEEEAGFTALLGDQTIHSHSQLALPLSSSCTSHLVPCPI